MAMSKISVSSTILFGKPCISGTRISVEQILACLSEGWTNVKIKKEFGISDDDIKACINFAKTEGWFWCGCFAMKSLKYD